LIEVAGDDAIKMMAMEPSPLPAQPLAGSTALESEKPTRAPRFEAYVMTGDAILNLSRTTHSPEFLPFHSRKKKIPQQTSNSVPNSPCELVHNGAKPWEQEKVEEPKNAQNIQNNMVPVLSYIRSSRSEDALHSCSEAEIEIKNQAEDDLALSYNTLLEPGKENERIVWTYNAPLTEQEMRRLEAEQFWMNSKQNPGLKQMKQLMSIRENLEVKQPVDSVNDHLGKSVNTVSVGENKENIGSVNVHHVADQVMEISSDKPSAKEDSELKLCSSGTEGNYRVISNEKPIHPTAGSPTDEDSDGDSLQSFHYSPKGVDMPSAIRLAKRYVACCVLKWLISCLIWNKFQIVYPGWISEIRCVSTPLQE
jgi:hypothetical protein